MTVSMRGNPHQGGGDTGDPNSGQQPNTPNQPNTTAPPNQDQSEENAQQPTEAVAGGGEDEGVAEAGESDFPYAELSKLDEMVNRPRWVVPVLPKGELETLLHASINLCKKGLDVKVEACQRFFSEGLTISFTKVFTDDAVSGWKFEIHRYILKNAELLVELCVTKLNQDWFPLLDLLAMVFNPQCKFHIFNGNRASESLAGTQSAENEIFSKPHDTRMPKGWLVDLINKFGALEGFKILQGRFIHGSSLTIPVIAALIRPWGLCYEFLTQEAIKEYFMPIIKVVPEFLDNLKDDELKKDSKNEAKNDAISSILKSLKCLASRVPNQEETIKNLEMFRLKMIHKLLQVSSFNGKMNALNEVNKVIAGVSYSYSRHPGIEEEEWLTAERVAEWIQQNGVLSIVLRDSLHQPQYVEKLEKILRFVIKEKTLTMEDLDSIWAAQAGKHEVIVKNVHDLLAKLAWDFSPEQLDHLFEHFQESWTNASKKQREKLLELIRRLAEDDKDGVMAHKVLGLLWNLAHSQDCPTDIMDQALNAHVKILDYSCSQDKEVQKTQWIEKFIDELKHDRWVIPALKQIKEICTLFGEAPQNYGHSRSPHIHYRHDIINQLQQTHSLVTIVTENLTNYMDKSRQLAKEHSNLDPLKEIPGSRYSHLQHVQERLNFLRFLLKDGQLWLCAPQAKQIWKCLAENSVYTCDREACFKWFSKLMGDEPDLDPEISRDFFESNVLQLDPALLTENGIKCFDRFFKGVNAKEGKMVVRRHVHLMDSMELIGIDYLWRAVLCSPAEIVGRAIDLLKETYTNLGPRLHTNQVAIHEDFIQSCMDRLKASFDTVSVLNRDRDRDRGREEAQGVAMETARMTRVLTVLREYVNECDGDYMEERVILPIGRAFRGKNTALLVRFPNQGRQVEDLDIWSHTNESLASVRRQILSRLKCNASTTKVDLYINGELLDTAEDRRLVGDIPLRDKTLITAKLGPAGSNMPSSPDSSSDSSTGSPHNTYSEPNAEAESHLPGVLMANQPQYVQFLFQLADLGSSLQIALLRDGARDLLRLMPPDNHTKDKIRSQCLDLAKLGQQSLSPPLDSLFFNPSSSQVLYHLEVCYALLMPASNSQSEETAEFRYNFIKSSGVASVLGMLTKNNFLPNADAVTRRAAYLNVLKLAKLLLTTVGHALVASVADAFSPEGGGHRSLSVSAAAHNHAVGLQQALQHVPSPTSECMLRNVAVRLGQRVKDQAKELSQLPDLGVVKAIKKIAWAAGNGRLHLLHSSNEEIHRAYEKPLPSGADEATVEEMVVCQEALEVLAVCLAVCPSALEVLNKDKAWQSFIVDLVLLCRSQPMRRAAAQQFFVMATKCTMETMPLKFFIVLCFTVLETEVKLHAATSKEYFSLLCQLLGFASATNTVLNQGETQLAKEISWLKAVRDGVLQTGEAQCPDALLEGHLGVTKELVNFQSPDIKFQIGSKAGGNNLIRELVNDFLFPASKIVLEARKTGEMPPDPGLPVCTTSATITAAFELLVALCVGCIPNFKTLSDLVIEMYYSDRDSSLVEWEFVPAIGPRPANGYVGLKNAGATCYMNSVLQQLYMVPKIKASLLAIDGVATEMEETDLDGDEKADNESNVDPGESESPPGLVQASSEDQLASSKEEERKDYNLSILRQVQAIFGHLVASKLQYYVPRGFWKQFKLWGEPVNLREQHDALEFFNSLVDSLDEALKSLGMNLLLSETLGGSFADQKICKGCPHRYSREESFTALNIDIRNHQNLLDSLEQYVKGDLLEGANAYFCEKCSKKVDTVKRLCIKKLPSVLAIQLKRFDYDWERECAIKFNDYFEFPREFDMEPYTVNGLAKIEGESIEDDTCPDNKVESEIAGTASTKYHLVGVLVHSGQASGGHYYSYILQRSCNKGEPKRWYKFDDGEVSECKMEDDEEMKNQCFGGEYVGEVFDHMMKRMSYRRQKRWWNAYILFYERVDVGEEKEDLSKKISNLSLAGSSKVKMPIPIENCVRKQNVIFMHNKMQFSNEYFIFIKKLLTSNIHFINSLQQDHPTLELEEFLMIGIQLASKFLFNVGFHTKKSIRGPANEWYDALCILLRHSKKVRTWFANNALFAHPSRFSEFLLECPSTEIRNAFAKILVFICHFSLQDGPYTPPYLPPYQQGQGSADPAASPASSVATGSTLSDHILSAVLGLLKREVPEHSRHLTQYFYLFQMYANLGLSERTQLLKLNVPAMFMMVSLDEGPGPPIKYQYAELGKLYSVVSQLIRCCDVSSRMQSSAPGKSALPNPYSDQNCPYPIMLVQPQVVDMLYGRNSYIKKLIEDCTAADETVKLLRFCCWENPSFSSTVLSELLWQVAYSYTYELRPYLDLLLQMLLIEDSWQTHRIHNALKGIPDDREGLFDTIQRSKNHYQKRAYQCIKCMVALFTNCGVAAQLLQSHGDLKRKWSWAVEWLGDELERRPYSGNTQYMYNNWSPPAQSNETSNGYFLERSQSARHTLAKACELCPEEDPEDEVQEDQDSSSQEDGVTHCHPHPSQHLHHQQNNQQRIQNQQPNNQQQTLQNNQHPMTHGQLHVADIHRQNNIVNNSVSNQVREQQQQQQVPTPPAPVTPGTPSTPPREPTESADDSLAPVTTPPSPGQEGEKSGKE